MLSQRAFAIEREGLGGRRRHFRLHAREVELGDIAGLVAALGEPQRVSVGRDGLAHDRALGVELAQIEVRLGHLRLHDETRALQQRLARLRVELRGVARLRELAEEVRFPGRAQARLAEIRRLAWPGAQARLDRGALHAGHRADLGQQVCLRVAQQGARLDHARRGGLQAGVAGRGARNEVVQRRIVERPPPGAARLAFGGSDGDEAGAAVFLECDRSGGCRARQEVRIARTAGQHECRDEREQRGIEDAVHVMSFATSTTSIHSSLWRGADAIGRSPPMPPPWPGLPWSTTTPGASTSCGISPCRFSGLLPVSWRSST